MRLRAFLLALLGLVLTGMAAAATLKRGNVAEPDTLDPQKYLSLYEGEIMRDLFMGLLTLDAKANIIPGAAESYETSPDGLTLTFILRADGKWSDGTPVTAEDFVLGFRRAVSPMTAAPMANFTYPIVNAEAANAGSLPPGAIGVTARDARTLEIKLKRPSATLPWLLAAFPLFFPVPRHVYDAHGENWMKAGTMVSNGAYQLAEWVPQSHVRLSANPHFHEAGTVTISEVFFYPTDDDAAALKRFRAGELDLNTRFAPGQLAFLRQELPAGAARTTATSWLGYIVLNQTRPPFNDARVRRALSLAIDRETLVTRVLGEGELAAAGPTPPFVPGYAPFADVPPAADRAAQLADARALLAEAGYGPERPLRFTFNHRIGEANRRVALAMRTMWAEAGIEAALESNEVKVHYVRLRQKQFEVADAGWSAPPDPEFFLELLTSNNELNFGGYNNPAYDALFQRAAGETDKSQRLSLFAELERLAVAETGLIPVYHPVERTLVQPFVQGFEANPVNYHPTRFMRIAP